MIILGLAAIVVLDPSEENDEKTDEEEEEVSDVSTVQHKSFWMLARSSSVVRQYSSLSSLELPSSGSSLVWSPM